MSKIKAIIDFTGYTASALGDLAQVIHDQFTAQAALFPAPPTALAAFQTQITDYQAKLVARASRAKADLLAFNDARNALEVTLAGFGNYVNTVAKGSATMVGLSGVPAYDTRRIADTTPPNAPQNVRVTHGELSGVIVVRYKPERRSGTNEIQVNLGDPNNEADWQQRALIKGGKAELSGFPPGVIVWVRVRSVGLRGVMGVWSDPAQIRTL